MFEVRSEGERGPALQGAGGTTFQEPESAEILVGRG